VGETFERYEIESLIGRGGMGEVYRATDTRLRRKVALKVLRPDRGGDEAVARLFREARSAAGLSHPNTVAIHDVGEAEGIFYIVMELVTGAPLLAYVGDLRVPVARKLGWLVDVARALAAAHKTGVIHRDVKPSNVMVSDDGVVKVLDFGLAKSLAPMSFRTQVGHSLGTPRYMSPEQMAGDEIDARSDQYAFALTAYELVAGKHPGGVLAGNVPPAPLESIAPDATKSVGQVLAQAMAMDPAARFASMDELVVALEDAIAGRQVRGLKQAASVAAMSAVPATVEEAVPFGATAGALASSDAQMAVPTASARTIEVATKELATAPTEARPDLQHVMGAAVPVGPAGTLIDPRAMHAALANAPVPPARKTLHSATSSPPPAGPAPAMRTLMSADGLRAPAPAASAAPAPISVQPSSARPSNAQPSNTNKPLIAAGVVVVLAVLLFGATYLGAKILATPNELGAASASASATASASVAPFPKPPETSGTAPGAPARAQPTSTTATTTVAAQATATVVPTVFASPPPAAPPTPTPTAAPPIPTPTAIATQPAVATPTPTPAPVPTPSPALAASALRAHGPRPKGSGAPPSNTSQEVR
jgi:serine/threonine-protein kinase